MGLEKAASRSRPLKTTPFWQWNLIVYNVSLCFWQKMYLCVFGKKLNFLSWVIRSVFADPVTYGLSYPQLSPRLQPTMSSGQASSDHSDYNSYVEVTNLWSGYYIRQKLAKPKLAYSLCSSSFTMIFKLCLVLAFRWCILFCESALISWRNL